MSQMPYHAGFIVANLEEGIRELEVRYGCTFNKPSEVTAPDYEDRVSGERGPLDLRIAYTKDSPFRLEVIERTGNGVYSEKFLGLHHLGVWEPDPAGRLLALEAAGDDIDSVVRDEEGSVTVIYARPATMRGARIEYVNEAQREAFERWFDTGVFS